MERVSPKCKKTFVILNRILYGYSGNTEANASVLLEYLEILFLLLIVECGITYRRLRGIVIGPPSDGKKNVFI